MAREERQKSSQVPYVYCRLRLTRLVSDCERQTIEQQIDDINRVEVLGWIDETLMYVKIHGADREGDLQNQMRLILKQFNAYS